MNAAAPTKSAGFENVKLCLNVMNSLMELLERQGGGIKDIRYLTTPQGEKLLQDFAETLLMARGSHHRYSVSVPEHTDLEDLIRLGRFNSINPEITRRNFTSPRKTEGMVHMELIHLPSSANTEEILEAIEKRGMRPAEISELLAFGIRYPSVQLEYPVIALGTLWVGPNGYRGVAGLWGHSGHRYLDLTWYDGNWNNTHRFAAVQAGDDA